MLVVATMPVRPKGTLAFWDTPVGKVLTADLSFKIGYLPGFMQGHLHDMHIGDNVRVRGPFKTCLAFASMATFDDAIRKHWISSRVGDG